MFGKTLRNLRKWWGVAERARAWWGVAERKIGAAEVTPEAVLGLFDEIRGSVVTAGDVADAFNCSTETARRKL